MPQIEQKAAKDAKGGRKTVEARIACPQLFFAILASFCSKLPAAGVPPAAQPFLHEDGQRGTAEASQAEKER
jgi:hypothetical protein